MYIGPVPRPEITPKWVPEGPEAPAPGCRLKIYPIFGS